LSAWSASSIHLNLSELEEGQAFLSKLADKAT
jgi:hypothetical protein